MEFYLASVGVDGALVGYGRADIAGGSCACSLLSLMFQSCHYPCLVDIVALKNMLAVLFLHRLDLMFDLGGGYALFLRLGVELRSFGCFALFDGHVEGTVAFG